MAKIIEFSERKKAHKPLDLNSLLKMAVDLKAELTKTREDYTVPDFKKLISANISGILLKNHMVDVDFFLCGLHIADLLAELVTNIPETWFAVDYALLGHKLGNPNITLQGAKICFLICSVFKKRAGVRAMTLSGYKELGAGLYYHFYLQTDKIIGYHMAKQFNPMANITMECMHTL